jgi:hypothetical protein
MSLIRRTLFTGTAALALTFSAAALGWSMNWGAGERVNGDGKIARETRALSGFDGISLSGPFELKLRQSNTPRVELEADGNLLSYVETRIVETSKGKTLEIGVKRGYSVYSRQALKIEVDLASLRAISIAGSGRADADSFKTERLDFSVAGSGTSTGCHQTQHEHCRQWRHCRWRQSHRSCRVDCRQWRCQSARLGR